MPAQARPAPRSRASANAPRGRVSADQGRNRRAAPRPGRGAPAPQSAPLSAANGTAAACVLLGPVVGAFLGKAIGGYSGPVFAIVCVLAAMVAAATVTPVGLWWVIPSPPLVIWVVGVVAELSWRNPPYQGKKEQAVGVAHGTVHSFPVMLAALLGMAVVVVATRMKARQRGSAHV
jgi:asparagine N-glycosylation enzyme membrane subunit Stt3